MVIYTQYAVYINPKYLHYPSEYVAQALVLSLNNQLRVYKITNIGPLLRWYLHVRKRHFRERLENLVKSRWFLVRLHIQSYFQFQLHYVHHTRYIPSSY